jgi:nitrite reductase/ring-hydroxylating ferredoxin subunit
LGDFIEAVNESDLTPGKRIPVEIANRELLLLNIDGKIYAISSVCTHEQQKLVDGLLFDTKLVCSHHFSEFDVRTGKVLSSPAELDLEIFETKIENGKIYVSSKPK